MGGKGPGSRDGVRGYRAGPGDGVADVRGCEQDQLGGMDCCRSAGACCPCSYSREKWWGVGRGCLGRTCCGGAWLGAREVCEGAGRGER